MLLKKQKELFQFFLSDSNKILFVTKANMLYKILYFFFTKED